MNLLPPGPLSHWLIVHTNEGDVVVEDKANWCFVLQMKSKIDFLEASRKKPQVAFTVSQVAEIRAVAGKCLKVATSKRFSPRGDMNL